MRLGTVLGDTYTLNPKSFGNPADTARNSVLWGSAPFVTGMHKSPYRGFSVEFAQHREYVAGDDLRHLDWKILGKSDRLVIKQYEEETNLRAHLFLDQSESMNYGHDGGMAKFDYAATACASPHAGQIRVNRRRRALAPRLAAVLTIH